MCIGSKELFRVGELQVLRHAVIINIFCCSCYELLQFKWQVCHSYGKYCMLSSECNCCCQWETMLFRWLVHDSYGNWVTVTNNTSRWVVSVSLTL